MSTKKEIRRTMESLFLVVKKFIVCLFVDMYYSYPRFNERKSYRDCTKQRPFGGIDFKIVAYITIRARSFGIFRY